MASEAPDDERARDRLLEAAERVFYARGIQAVSMAELRTAAELPLKRIYALYPGKDEVVCAFLRRRHDRMMAVIGARVDAAGPGARVAALFDWLRDWCAEPGFRGCAWMNAYGELGPTNEAIAAEALRHKRVFHEVVTGVPLAEGHSPAVAEGVHLLVEGAITAAQVERSPAPADRARAAALLLTSRGRDPGGH
ncbi:TetR/AcrR family transcriptional regulator [Streptomyces sp. NPDC050560]|uniref:TetR/AcrR family transcriptional regulator n=1 Tax=Streptomyces sp. NPDC050560 TaxID=3365630 RepID=UPI0037BC4590